MYKIAVCVIILMSVSCIRYKKPIAGKYERSAKGLNNFNRLILDTNHTFKFAMYLCVGRQVEEGTWYREKNKLILNSFPFVRNNDSLSVLLESKKINDDDSITFELIDDSLEMLYGVNVSGFLQGEIIGRTISGDGMTKIKSYKYDSIILNGIGYSQIVIHPDKNNYYKIKMRTENAWFLNAYNLSFHLINEQWQIGRNKLFDPIYNKHKRKNAYFLIK